MRKNFWGKLSFTTDDKHDIIVSMFCVLFLFLLGWFLYSPSIFHALYSDDLGLVQSASSKDFIGFTLGTGVYKLRPVFQSFFYILWELSGQNVYTLQVIVVFLNCVAGVGLFIISSYIFRNKLVSFSIGVVYLISRFAYYQVMQLFGVMENMAQLFALISLITMLDYIINKRNKSVWWSLIVYLLAIYTHERYVALIAFLILGIWCRSAKESADGKPPKRILYSVFAALICLSFIIIRKVMFNEHAWAGTGGTDMDQTFSIESVLNKIWLQLCYLFGWGANEQYLSGYGSANVGWFTNGLTIMYDVSILLLFAFFFIHFFRDRQEKRFDILKALIMIIVFIGACIVSSSTTIRVEMRWIYVSQTAMLLGIGVLILYNLRSANKILRYIIIAVSACTFISAIIIENNYRQGWKNIYFYRGLVQDSSLVDNTVLAYSDLSNHDLIIVDSSGSLDLDNAQKQIQIMTPEKTNIPRSIKRYTNAYQVPHKEWKEIVLEYANGKFKDISGLLSKSDIQKTLSGKHYSDGWTTNDLEIEIYPYFTGTYQAVFYTNQPIESQFTEEERKVTVTINENEEFTFIMTEYPKVLKLNLNINTSNTIRVQTSFASENLVREGDKLSYTLFFNQLF